MTLLTKLAAAAGPDRERTRTAQIDECLELAQAARQIGDDVTFLAAVNLAAQLVQLAKIEAATQTALTARGIKGD